MKTFLLLVTWLVAAVTSVAAVGPILPGTHRFSRKSMKEWKKYFKSDKEVVSRYNEMIQWIKKSSPGQEMQDCPDQLKDAQIKLVKAIGRYVKQTSTGRFPGTVVDWTHLPTTDTGKLNDVEFTFLVLGDRDNIRCGQITAKTDSEGRHWEKPYYSHITSRTALMLPIDLDLVIFSAGATYDDAKTRISDLVHGFWALDLVKLFVYNNIWPEPRLEPVYRFRGMKGDKDAIILVGAADMRIRYSHDPMQAIPRAPTRAAHGGTVRGINLEE